MNHPLRAIHLVAMARVCIQYRLMIGLFSRYLSFILSLNNFTFDWIASLIRMLIVCMIIVMECEMELPIHYILMKAHTALNKKILSRAYEIGLSPGQPRILEYLVSHDGNDQKTIATNCEIEPATVGSILGRMENMGLIERRQREGNRRSLFVFLTDKGRAAAAQMENIFIISDKQVAKDLTEKDIYELTRILTKLYSNLTNKN